MPSVMLRWPSHSRRPPARRLSGRTNSGQVREAMGRALATEWVTDWTTVMVTGSVRVKAMDAATEKAKGWVTGSTMGSGTAWARRP